MKKWLVAVFVSVTIAVICLAHPGDYHHHDYVEIEKAKLQIEKERKAFEKNMQDTEEKKQKSEDTLAERKARKAAEDAQFLAEKRARKAAEDANSIPKTADQKIAFLLNRVTAFEKQIGNLNTRVAKLESKNRGEKPADEPNEIGSLEPNTP